MIQYFISLSSITLKKHLLRIITILQVSFEKVLKFLQNSVFIIAQQTQIYTKFSMKLKHSIALPHSFRLQSTIFIIYIYYIYSYHKLYFTILSFCIYKDLHKYYIRKTQPEMAIKLSQ